MSKQFPLKFASGVSVFVSNYHRHYCSDFTTHLIATIEQCVLSWSAMNSRASPPMTKTEIGQLPIRTSSPTDISTVYTVMKTIQDLTIHILTIP